MDCTNSPPILPLTRRDLLRASAVALAARQADAAPVLKFEPPDPAELPQPEMTVICQSRNAAGWTTAITRTWAPGVTYCGRCPRERCTLDGGVCMLMVQELVRLEDASEFSTQGRTWLNPAPAPSDGGSPR